MYNDSVTRTPADVADTFRIVGILFLIVPVIFLGYVANSLIQKRPATLEGITELSILLLLLTGGFLYATGRGIARRRAWATRVATVVLWLFLAALWLPFIWLFYVEDLALASIISAVLLMAALLLAHAALRALFVLHFGVWPYTRLARLFPDLEPLYPSQLVNLRRFGSASRRDANQPEPKE